MICNRMKQFREYNGIEAFVLADALGISVEEYNNYESGKEQPNISIIQMLARYYKVSVDEFYGYTPRLALHNKDLDTIDDEDDVPERLLKMADLSWDESKLILYYRSIDEKDDIIKSILNKEKNNE